MKICVISFITNNNKFNKVAELSKEINKKYCDLNNYDFIFENYNYDRKDYKDIFWFSDSDEKYNKDFDTHVFLYHKFELLEKYLPNYDYVVFLDYDACFVNPTKKIEDLTDNLHDLFLIQHSLLFGSTLWPIQIYNFIINYLKVHNISFIKNFVSFCNEIKEKYNGYEILNNYAAITCNPYSFNGGFILCKNSPIIFDFIKDVKKYHPLFFHKSCDEGTMGMILQMKKYENIFKIYSYEYMGNYNLQQQPEYYLNEDTNFIAHQYGASTDVKINGFNKIKENKWWNNYFK